MYSRLEHANLTVRNLDATVAFLQAALPDYRIRGQGTGTNGRWLHVGTERSYVALEEASQNEAGAREPYADPGVNHLGFEVADADAVKARLLAAGYREGIQVEAHRFRKRVYFFDPDGNEYEFVQYLSADPVERNRYDD